MRLKTGWLLAMAAVGLLLVGWLAWAVGHEPPPWPVLLADIIAVDAYFSARLAGFVLDAFRGEGPGGLNPELDQLTRRERDVLRLIAAGYTYKEIGVRLSISPRTVETHAASVLRKLQLSNRQELLRWAKLHWL